MKIDPKGVIVPLNENMKMDFDKIEEQIEKVKSILIGFF